MNELRGLPLPRKIAVFRALMLGDLLCAVPAFRALRAAHPDARIILIGLPWAREFVDRYRAYLDGFHEFPGYPGLAEREPDMERLPAFFAAMRAERFDLAIQMHGSGRVSNPLVMQLGASASAGFYEPGQDCPDPATFLPYPGRGLELRRLLKLMEFLGVPPRGESLEFPIREADRDHARQLATSRRLSTRRVVIIHPGASVAERRWPAASFAKVGDALAARGYSVAVTGTAGEAALAGAVVHSMRFPAVDLAGQTALGPLAALLAGARLLVCNDTGVSHLADALGVRSVVISTGDNPERWAPVDGRRHRVLCNPSGVSPEDVVAEAVDVLAVEPVQDRSASSLDPVHPGGPLTATGGSERCGVR